MNAVRYFLPHVFALSVNSPFWCGRVTGWQSYRAKVFERFPRTGIPDYFGRGAVRGVSPDAGPDRMHRQRQEDLVDVRPHPFFPTLEYRICDLPMRVDETICFAALFQALTISSGSSTAQTWGGGSTAGR